jgi:HEAT repeat protein
VKMKWSMALSLLLILSIGSPLSATRPVKPSKNVWAELERELALQGIATDAASVAKAALSNPDLSVRWTAVELLGLRGDVSAKGALRKIVLNDDSRLLRETAALALARLGEPGAVKELKSFLESAEDPERELFLAARLAELGDLSGYPIVVKAARSEKEDLRFLSVESLVRFAVSGQDKLAGEESPAGLLLHLLNDPNGRIRSEVLVQLSTAQSQGLSLEPYVGKIERMAKDDPDAGMREQAQLLLTSWKEFGKPRSER